MMQIYLYADKGRNLIEGQSYLTYSISAQKKSAAGSRKENTFHQKKKTGGGLEKMKRTGKQERTQAEPGGNH